MILACLVLAVRQGFNVREPWERMGGREGKKERKKEGRKDQVIGYLYLHHRYYHSFIINILFLD